MKKNLLFSSLLLLLCLAVVMVSTPLNGTTVAIDNQADTAPYSPTISSATNGVEISWAKNNVAKRYDEYRLQYTNGKWGEDWKLVTSTTSTSFTDKTAKKGKTYSYYACGVYKETKSDYKASSKIKR